MPSRRIWVRVPPVTKIFLCRFFRLYKTFFRKFFNASRGSPFFFFLFCKRMDAHKLPKGPLLHFSALCDLPETNYSNKKFKKFGTFFFTRVLWKRILDTLKSSCCFGALDWAPTWAVPGLFKVRTISNAKNFYFSLFN